MIPESRNFNLCGQEFCLTKPQIMQCLVMHAQSDAIENLRNSMTAEWDKKFPTLEALYLKMPGEMSRLLNLFLDNVNHIFWNEDEVLPYDRKLLESCIPAIIDNAGLYEILEELRRQAIQIVDLADEELGNTSNFGLSQGFLTVGIGLRGMIEAGAVNLGANLLDLGIQSVLQNSVAKKYQKQLEELRHGSKTISVFYFVLDNLVSVICSTITNYIAGTYQIPSVLDEEKNFEWLPDAPPYRNYNRQERIQYCLTTLQKCPIIIDVFRELVTLTRGRDQTLIDFGNDYISKNIGTKFQEEVLMSEYQTAMQLPENTFEETSSKIAALKEISKINSAFATKSEKDLTRLANLCNEQKASHAYYEETVLLVDHLSKDTEEELLNSPLFYETDGWKTFIQELYYRNHSLSDDFIQKFEDRGNGVPRLIQLEKELDAHGGVEPVQQWTKWAKRGYPYALFRLGLCRLYGNGIQRDLIRSKQLLERAVATHYPPAIYILYKMAHGEYNPKYTDITVRDKEEYSYLLKIFSIPDEWYHIYLKFGRLSSKK